jgi:valyl-tRNA synthetase
VRDDLGRKMSKSLGNSPDPLDLIGNYGADGVRAGMLFSSPAGNDLLYSEKLVEQGRNFSNKIWNAFRLVHGWQVDEKLEQTEDNITAAAWFEERMTMAINELEDHFSRFRISDALHAVYKLIWNDFCSWYLEMVKPEFEKPVDKITYNQTVGFFKTLLRSLHPFMPFITEELWSHLRDKSDAECIIVAPWPSAKPSTSKFIEESERAFLVVKEIRDFRNKKGISPKETLTLHCAENPFPYFGGIVRKLTNINEFQVSAEKPEGSTLMAGTMEFIVPLAVAVDVDKERESIDRELTYLRGFLESVDKKLSNEKFVSSAPAKVIENERKKKADAEAKIAVLEQSKEKLGISNE